MAAFANTNVGFGYVESPNTSIPFTPAASGTLLIGVTNPDVPSNYTLGIAVSP